MKEGNKMKNSTNKICQSCGMPMKKDEDFGTNSDTSKNTEYCKFCYTEGQFTSKVSLNEFIEKQVQLATEKMGIPEDKARMMANDSLPNLKRWKK